MDLNAAYSGNSKLVISSVNAENHYRGRELLKRIGSFFFFFFYADSCNFVAPPWPHTMRIRCIGEYHTLKFFFENDASRTSFFLYSFLWPEFAPVTFDACKRHESIYLALLFFLGNNITYLRISIVEIASTVHLFLRELVFHLFSNGQKIDSFKRKILFLSSTRFFQISSFHRQISMRNDAI